jgi:plasmid stabilization system protein ParE
MPVSVRVRPGAAADLLQAEVWYEEKSPGLGREFLVAFEAAMETVAASPKAFPSVLGGVRCRVLRRFPFGVFSIQEGRSGVVLAVLQKRRSPDRWPLG